MKTQTIPIRLDAATAHRASSLARRLGIGRSAVVRLALMNQLQEIESGVLRIRKNPESKMQIIEQVAQ